MTKKLALAVLAFSVGVAPFIACAAEPLADSASEPEVVARSPRGSFRIEHRWRRDQKGENTGTYDSFIVPEKPQAGAATALESDVEPVRHYSFSADERWIYAEFKLYTRRSSCELFERKQGFQFVKAFTKPAEDGGNFDEAMWKFFTRSTGLEHAEYPRLCDFVAWAPDSSRLLVALRGVAAPKSWKPDRAGEIDSAPGVYGWKVYWNTAKHDFELTKMLTQDNAQAAKRWRQEGEGADSREPFCAEPMGPLPPVEELDRQISDLRAKIEQAWVEGAAGKQKQGAKPPNEDERPWAKIEEGATAWRQARTSEIEKASTTFAQRWPEKDRGQWRRLSLRGRLEVVLDEVQRGWPWLEN